MKRKFSILFAVVLAISLTLVPAAVSADDPPTIDGTLSPGEWDSHLLGTSVTTWGGGMSVDVYGFADDTHLYAAYVADMTQPGWSVAASLGISCNLYYRTPQSASWPGLGYTILGFGGDGIGQTDGSGWNFDSFGGWGIQSNEWANEGIEYYVGDGMYNTVPNPNVAEVKIPLSLLTYAGADGQIRLSGQYWQYDSATPFFVALAPPITTVTLYAGQTIPVGTVTVWNDGDYLYVEYETTDGWEMTETHLHVATTLDGIPQTEETGKGKNTGGNPIPGQFDWSMEHDPPVSDYLYTIPLDGWDADTPLYIAAHAEVVKVMTMTVVSDTDTIVVDDNNLDNAVLAWVHPAWNPGLNYNFSDDADWIWESYRVVHPIAGDIVDFEKTFSIPGNPTAGTLHITCDNGYEVSVNGNLVGSAQLGADWRGSNLTEPYVYASTAGGDHWNTVENYDISSLLAPGANTLAIAGVNEYMGPDDGESYGTVDTNPAGLIFEAEITSVQEETAWAGTDVGVEPFPGKNWATYFQYTVAE